LKRIFHWPSGFTMEIKVNDQFAQYEIELFCNDGLQANKKVSPRTFYRLNF